MDAVFGVANLNDREFAHLLPHQTGLHPALWTWSRLLGFAPWSGSQEIKRAKESAKNLCPLPHSVHKAIDSGCADAHFRLCEEDLALCVRVLEEWLAEEEERLGALNSSEWVWKLEDFSGRLQGVEKVFDDPALRFEISWFLDSAND